MTGPEGGGGKGVAGKEAPDRLVMGVISDTHGLLREEAVAALEGVDVIVHAGDVDDPGILRRLQRIAPVRAVRGNVDRGPWAEGLPSSRVVQAGGRLVYVVHDPAKLDLAPDVAGFDVVVHGHTHRPRIEWVGGVLYLNPGSAGPRRARRPVSVARMTLGPEPPEARIVELDV